MKLTPETTQILLDLLLSTDPANVRLGAYMCYKQLRPNDRVEVLLLYKKAIEDRIEFDNWHTLFLDFEVLKYECFERMYLKIHFAKYYIVLIGGEYPRIDLEYQVAPMDYRLLKGRKAATCFFKFLSNYGL
jgi:hypothetical protein